MIRLGNDRFTLMLKHKTDAKVNTLLPFYSFRVGLGKFRNFLDLACDIRKFINLIW